VERRPQIRVLRPQAEKAPVPVDLDRPHRRRLARPGISYNQFISGLKKAGVELDRKILADIAYERLRGFWALCETAKRANTKAA